MKPGFLVRFGIRTIKLLGAPTEKMLEVFGLATQWWVGQVVLHVQPVGVALSACDLEESLAIFAPDRRLSCFALALESGLPL